MLSSLSLQLFYLSILWEFARGRCWLRRSAGRKWKKPFPAKVSGSERLVYYNGLMDPPGCLLSLHYIGEMLTKAKLASLLVSYNALYSVVKTLPFNRVACRKGKK